MEGHRHALRALADACGLPEPFEFHDDGRRASDGLPQLECLVRHAEHGVIDTLLVPGLFVFALDDIEAAAVARRLRRSGCRIIELPSSRPHRAGPDSTQEP
ncbi:hypothetical protein [Streptomyces sp. C10-9-1]|uniref:hypothetical protein n=1 Tax=Streptomyces sp. C10-9-1 TaxID=1859285 RepID=UPI003F4A2F18